MICPRHRNPLCKYLSTKKTIKETKICLRQRISWDRGKTKKAKQFKVWWRVQQTKATYVLAVVHVKVKFGNYLITRTNMITFVEKDFLKKIYYKINSNFSTFEQSFEWFFRQSLKWKWQILFSLKRIFTSHFAVNKSLAFKIFIQAFFNCLTFYSIIF